MRAAFMGSLCDSDEIGTAGAGGSGGSRATVAVTGWCARRPGSISTVGGSEVACGLP